MKILETTKAILKAIVLSVLTMFALATSAQAEKYNPVTLENSNDPVVYETAMRGLYKSVTAKDAENYRLCKIFSEKGKEYKALNRSDVFYDVTVKNCERRVKLYCGALMAAKQAENNETK